MITELKLRLPTDVATLTGIFNNASDTPGRALTFVRIARLTVTHRLPVLLPIYLFSIALVVVGSHLADDQTTQKTGDDRQQCDVPPHRLILITDDRVHDQVLVVLPL